MLTRIRFRILGIVLLAIIPAVALIWYSAADRKRQMSAEIEGNTLRLSRFLASNLERDLSEGRLLLRSVSEALREKRLPESGCPETLQALLEDSSVYANMGLAGSDGKVLCSARPAVSIIGLSALEWFHKLDSASGFSVGFDFNGGISAEPSIVLVQPASAAGLPQPPGSRRYVFAVMQVGWLNQLAESSRLPPGSAVSVTNIRGDAVARYPDPDKWVGKSRQPPRDLDSLDAAQGTRVTNGIDGIKRLYAYAKVAGKGNLVVNVGVDRDAILAPANRALRNQLIALGIVALLAILAAWFGSDVFLLKQVRTLIKATKDLGSGNLAARSGLSYDSGELGELAKAFDEMAETLEWRNAQLRESDFERTDALAKLAEFADCVPEAFLVMDDSFTVQAANEEAAALFDTERSGLLGKSFRELCPEIPIGETERALAGDPDPSGQRVHRLRARTGRAADPDRPFAVEISMAKRTFAQLPYFLALLKRSLHPVSETP